MEAPLQGVFAPSLPHQWRYCVAIVTGFISANALIVSAHNRAIANDRDGPGVVVFADTDLGQGMGRVEVDPPGGVPDSRVPKPKRGLAGTLPAG